MIYIIVTTDMLDMNMYVTCYSTKKEFEIHKALAEELERKDQLYEGGNGSIRHDFHEVPLLGKSLKKIALSITKACHGDTISDVIDQIDELDTEENNNNGEDND